ncbi:MAG: TraI domain-containing protein [Anaerolineaceae bacterium]|nr:TraI domain-containing protein [Anaerolineaceae bacterium]
MSLLSIVPTPEKTQLKVYQGCILTQHAYPVVDGRPGISLTLENLHDTYNILLEPGTSNLAWGNSQALAVTLQANPVGDWLFCSPENIQPLQPRSLLHLPSSQLHSADCVQRTENLFQSCPITEIRQFVFSVLGDTQIGCAYFSFPASRDHHHSVAGGLAEHSLEVAKSVFAATSGFDEHERWLAATVGLLHDLGKVRTFQANGKRTLLGRLVTHEQITLELLVPAINQLESSWPDGAYTIRYLLNWLLAPRQTRPLMPIALAIKQADIMSAAADSRRQAFSGKPDWQRLAAHETSGPRSLYWLPSRPPQNQ